MQLLLALNALLLVVVGVKLKRNIHYILEAENDDSSFNDWNFNR